MDHLSDGNALANAKHGTNNHDLSIAYHEILQKQHEDKCAAPAKLSEDLKKHTDKLLAAGVLKNCDIVDAKSTDLAKVQECRNPHEAKEGQDSPYKLISSAERPELTNQFIRTEGWTGADAAYSIPLSNDRTLWLFGDTVIGDIKQGRRTDSTLINNSGAIQDTNNPSKPFDFVWNAHDTKPEPLFKPDDPNEWFWPGDGVTVNGKLYVFLHSLHHKPDDSSSWGFESGGEKLAQIDNPLDDPSKWHVQMKQLPNGIQFGDAVVAKDGYIYSFGQYPPGSNDKHPTVLARLATDKLGKMDVDSWEYLCHESPGSEKTVWRSEPKDPQALMPDGATEMTVSQVKGIPGYFATYTSHGFGKNIVIRHADKLEGPWSDPQTVFVCPEDGKSFTYAAKAHPELATKDGEMVITYCRNSDSLQDLVDKPYLYVPHAITVMLSTGAGGVEKNEGSQASIKNSNIRS